MKSDKKTPQTETEAKGGEVSNSKDGVVLHICSAYKECGKAKECRHAKPHECENVGMHRFNECYDSEPHKLMSCCLTVRDGKIPVSKTETCKCCGHSKHVTKYESIS